MKKRYIPLEKQSKQKQREYHAARRGSWGEVNPVTRKSPNPKAYNRKKSGQRYEHEPMPGFYLRGYKADQPKKPRIHAVFSVSSGHFRCGCVRG